MTSCTAGGDTLLEQTALLGKHVFANLCLVVVLDSCLIVVLHTIGHHHV